MSTHSFSLASLVIYLDHLSKASAAQFLLKWSTPPQAAGYPLRCCIVIPCLTRNPVLFSGYRLSPVWRIRGKPRGIPPKGIQTVAHGTIASPTRAGEIEDWQIRVKLRLVRILKSDASAWGSSLRSSGNTFIWIIVRITYRDKAIYLPSIVESSIFPNNALITIRCAAWKE